MCLQLLLFLLMQGKLLQQHRQLSIATQQGQLADESLNRQAVGSLEIFSIFSKANDNSNELCRRALTYHFSTQLARLTTTATRRLLTHFSSFTQPTVYTDNVDSVAHGAIFTAFPYTFRAASHSSTTLACVAQCVVFAGSLMQRQVLVDEIKSVNLLFILVVTVKAFM